MKKCAHCGAEISSSAKVCPQCGGKNKKPIYKRPWFIVLIVALVIAVVGNSGTSDSNSDSLDTSQDTSPVPMESQSIISEEPDLEPEISYTAYEVSELMNDLDENALKASEKYKDQYVELTGRLNVIDSSGKYISIVPTDDEWAILGVQCYIKSEEQKDAVLNMAIGDTVVIKGKITQVGEVMAYSLDIDEIVQ